MNTGSQITATDTAQLTNADARPSAAAIDTDHANAMATIVCPIMTRLLDAIAAIAGIAESSVTMPRAAAGSVTKYAAREIPAIPTSPRTENIRSDNFPTTSVIKKIAVDVAHTPSRYTGAPSRNERRRQQCDRRQRNRTCSTDQRTAIDRVFRPLTKARIPPVQPTRPHARDCQRTDSSNYRHPTHRHPGVSIKKILVCRRTCTANIRS